MAKDKAAGIYASGLTIYDSLRERPDLYLETALLEELIGEQLLGKTFDQPIRTRSKRVKEEVCRALGYPIPSSFRKTHPRFPGQNLDVYVQKSNNLQIWNEELSASRRYALVRLDKKDVVQRVRVVTGAQLAALDASDTLTRKYQAKSKQPIEKSLLVVERDTENFIAQCLNQPERWAGMKSIRDVYDALLPLQGIKLPNPGNDQERLRGAALHAAICKALGYEGCKDDGQFPDLREQLIEIKLQTATTVDLGLIQPDSTDRLADFPSLRHCDVRYALFYGKVVEDEVKLEHLVLTPGSSFFTHFDRFGGNVVNTKNQIALPTDFFNESQTHR